MRRSVLVGVMVGLTLIATATGADAQTCGAPDPNSDIPVRGSLKFQEGRVEIDFRTEDQPQRISASFELANCHLKTEEGLRVIAVAAEGGDDLPAAAIGEPQMVASGDGVIVQVPIDPTALEAGTYATKWQLSGVPVFTASFKTKITRSFANSALPTAVASIGGLIGFAVAIAGAFAAARATGGTRVWNIQTKIALVFGAGLAAGAVFQVYLTQYADVTVWLPTVGNYGKLGLAAGAAAAGGGVAGQLAKLFSSRNGRDGPPPNS